MKKLLSIIALVLVVNFSFGQTNQGEISITGSAFGVRYNQGGVRITKTQMADILRPNDLAYQNLNSFHTKNLIGNLLGGVGGFLMGYPVGGVIGGGKDMDWVMFGVGVGIAGVSLPIYLSGESNRKKAMELYNSSLPTESANRNIELRLGVTPNGIGLAMRF